MKQHDSKWVNEAQAAELLGLAPHRVRANVVHKGLLDIEFTRATLKSEPRYSRKDIERILAERAQRPAA